MEIVTEPKLETAAICDPLGIILCTGYASDSSVPGSATKRDFDLSAIEAEFVVLDNKRGIGSGRELARERRRDGSKGGGFKKSYPTAGCFLQIS